MEPLDKKSLEKKQIKEKKWWRMVQHWQDTNKVPDDLKSRIWKGCPDSLRGRVWPLMLRIKEIKQSNEKQHGPNMYEVSLCAGSRFLYVTVLGNLITIFQPLL